MKEGKAYIGDEIAEGNKLVSKFMDMEQHEDYDYLYCRKLGSIYSRLQYHSSWDWLMPVVEKIRELGYGIDIIIGSIGCDVHITKGGNRLNIVAYSKAIDAIYTACVQFITWYNQNKQS